MINKKDMPMLSTEEQIKHLESKGVKFEYISKEEAAEYLQKNNNYFKLRAYRKNFPKHPGGEKEGQYINLDFAELKDLAIIDMRMRYVFIHMALDIEHFAKVKLLRAIEESDDDGYQIVEDYLQNLKDMDARDGTHLYDAAQNELDRNIDNSYCGGIIKKYAGCYPVWAFIEIISFGSLIHFYSFCAGKLGNKELKDDYYLLMTIKELRNAAAHSNCIIHDMGAKDSSYTPNYKVLRALKGISKATKTEQMKNERMRQMATLLYTHSVIVTSEGIHEHIAEELRKLVDRMKRHSDYYTDNQNIMCGFAFFEKCIDILFGNA